LGILGLLARVLENWDECMVGLLDDGRILPMVLRRLSAYYQLDT